MIGAHVQNENLPVNLLDVGSRELAVTNWGKGVVSFGLDDTHPPSPLYTTFQTVWYPEGHPKYSPDPVIEVFEEGMGNYCARDAGFAHLIFRRQAKKIKENPELFNLMRWLILPGLHGVLQMELNGIWIDMDRLNEREPILLAEIKELEEKLLSFVPDVFQEVIRGIEAKKVAPGKKKKKWYENDNFMRKWIFGKAPDGLGLIPLYFTDKKKEPKVDKDSLAPFKDVEEIATYLALNDKNTLTKFFNQWRTYIDDEWRLHPSFNMTGTVTGRRSATEPNLMQVPRDKFVRSIIGAPPGWKFLEIDYSQIEVRLVAWFAREETMMSIFRKGGDIYAHTAAAVMKISDKELLDGLEAGEGWAKEARQKAKAMVLGFLYGMSANSFGTYAFNTYNVVFTQEECKTFRDEFFREYPALIKWHEECKLIARKKHEIHSILGRTRHLMNVMSAELYERGQAERQAINSPVQGTGGDLLLMAIGTLTKEMPLDEVRLCGDIHDALLVQVREDVWEKWAAHIYDRFINPPVLAQFGIQPPIPLEAEVKIGQHWGEGKVWNPKEYKQVA